MRIWYLYTCYLFDTCYLILDTSENDLPQKIIRNSVIDDELLNELFSKFLSNNNFYELLKLGKYNLLSEPLQQSFFKNICYVYQSSVYTDNYLKSMINANNKIDNKFNIIIEKINTDENTLSENLKNLLTSNCVSTDSFKNSENKTLFIINSSTPQQLLDLFDNSLYGDNYIIFGDPFFNENLINKISFNLY